jgi:hypothetical protein
MKTTDIIEVIQNELNIKCYLFKGISPRSVRGIQSNKKRYRH